MPPGNERHGLALAKRVSGQGSTKFCQQWTDEKRRFHQELTTLSGLHGVVVLAWMAVESGGALNDPAGAQYNFLQVKGEGRSGHTPGGLAIFKSVEEAVGTTYTALRARGIHKSAVPEVRFGGMVLKKGTGPRRQMRAIAETWKWGSANPQTLESSEGARNYLASLEAKYECAGRDLVGRVPGASDEAFDTAGELAQKANPLDDVGQWIEQAVSSLARELWPVLLRAALVAFALALIGHGLKSAFSSTTVEGVQRNAPVAAEAIK